MSTGFLWRAETEYSSPETRDSDMPKSIFFDPVHSQILKSRYPQKGLKLSV